MRRPPFRYNGKKDGSTPFPRAPPTKAQLCAIVDRRNKIAHAADLDPGNPGERWPIDRPLVEEVIDFIESTIRAIYEVAGPART